MIDRGIGPLLYCSIAKSRVIMFGCATSRATVDSQLYMYTNHDFNAPAEFFHIRVRYQTSEQQGMFFIIFTVYMV